MEQLSYPDAQRLTDFNLVYLLSYFTYTLVYLLAVLFISRQFDHVQFDSESSLNGRNERIGSNEVMKSTNYGVIAQGEIKDTPVMADSILIFRTRFLHACS